jgi:hypothetical protein
VHRIGVGIPVGEVLRREDLAQSRVLLVGNGNEEIAIEPRERIVLVAAAGPLVAEAERGLVDGSRALEEDSPDIHGDLLHRLGEELPV